MSAGQPAGLCEELGARSDYQRLAHYGRPRSAGSVGVAGEFCGVYPRASPGGWLLLGRTDLVLWDTDADPPATLTPGTRVRFVVDR